jgi:hypothetical protein
MPSKIDVRPAANQSQSPNVYSWRTVPSFVGRRTLEWRP